MRISKKLLKQLREELLKMPTFWEGRTAILEMKTAKYPHWRQMEWIGWYFQYLCEKYLSPLVQIPGPKYGRVEFDGLAEIPWDFKAHPSTNARGQASNLVVANDREATAQAIRQYGASGLVLAIGNAIFNDENRSFQRWHKKLKGGASHYEKERIRRKAPSRLRKTAFELQEIYLIEIDQKTIQQHPSFQEGFRNADGSPRKAKVLLDLAMATPDDIIKYSKKR